jgi:hypothetical protein
VTVTRCCVGEATKTGDFAVPHGNQVHPLGLKLSFRITRRAFYTAEYTVTFSPASMNSFGSKTVSSSKPSMDSSDIETNPLVSSPGNSLLVRANEGRTLHAFGHAIMVLLDGKQTDGKSTAFLNITPPVVLDHTTTNAKTNGSTSSKVALVFC